MDLWVCEKCDAENPLHKKRCQNCHLLNEEVEFDLEELIEELGEEECLPGNELL